MKKLFTLIEILFVVLIIGVLLTIFSNLRFSDEKQKLLKAQWCVNIVVWKLSNYINMAFTAKWIYTWGKDVYPDLYIVELVPKYNIYFKYYDWVTGHYYDLNLLSATFKWKWCEGVYFSWKKYSILLYSWLEPDIWRWWFEIYDENNNIQVYTGEEYFYFNLTWYRPRVLWKIYIDSRAKKIFYYSCQTRSGDLFNCIKRR